MTDNEPEFSKKKQISITDEFSELLLLRPDGQDAQRERVVDAVMERIRGTPVANQPQDVLVAIGGFAKPAAVIAVAAAALFAVVNTRSGADDRVGVVTPAPSTAQALGLGAGIARWSDRRDRAPQLLEVAVDLSSTNR